MKLIIDESTGKTPAEAAMAAKALQSGKSYIVPQLGENVDKIEQVPDLINCTPQELFAVLSDSRYQSPAPCHQTFAGTSASGTLTFNAASLDDEVKNDHEIIGLDFNIRFSGDDTSLATDIVLTGAGMYGAYSLNTSIIAKERKACRVILLFHGMASGQLRLHPLYVGAKLTQQVTGVLAHDTTTTWSGDDLSIVDKTLTVAISNSLNKTVKVTLIDGGYAEAEAHLAQFFAQQGK